MPLYPLYALLFADVGLTDAGISALFALWSVTGLLAEVPTGALGDRFSRRGAIVAGGVAQALGYACWTLWPSFPAFAVGFVLWGIGGSLVSGSIEALLYDGLAAVGASRHFGRVYGQVRALELVAQLPAAGLATALFAVGGFPLVGWASVGTCLVAAALAARLPEPPRAPDPDSDDSDVDIGYAATLRRGLVEALRSPGVRGAIVAVALLTSLDDVEEYFPLLARDSGVTPAANPGVVVAITLCGALGAWFAGRWARPRTGALTAALAMGVLALGAPLLAAHPGGLTGVVVFYAVYRCVLVLAESRLQERIDSRARATVTSVAGLGTDLAGLFVFGAWALHGLPAVIGLGLLVVAVLPLGFGRGGRRGPP